MTPQPLAGLRVLELGNYFAAPTAGRLLADFGAGVGEVERPGTGDEIRTWRLQTAQRSTQQHANRRGGLVPSAASLRTSLEPAHAFTTPSGR